MDSHLREAVVSAVEHLKDDMLRTLQQLVRIPSVVGGEGKAQAFMQKQFETLGLDVHPFEADHDRVKNHIAFVESNIPYHGRPNLIGILKGDPRKQSIVLNGHIDVVSPEPIDQWKHDPWGAEVEENRLYGRGALDMKAGLVANLYSIRALERIGEKPQGTVILQSVIEEEAGGGGGTLACLVEGYGGDGMIISEPDPVPCISHAGILYFRVKLKGKTSHAGEAHTGVNAIGKMMKIYQALVQLDKARAATVSFPLFEKGSGRSCHLNIGTMKAGDWPSTVAGFAEMECRISFVPGEKLENIQRTVESTIREVAGHDPWLREHLPIIEWFGWRADPWYQDPSDPLVGTVVSSVASIVGEKLEPVGIAAGLDTRFSQYFGFPAVSFGPGGENIHGIDEYVDLDTFETATKAIALATLEWCSRDRKTLNSQ